MKQLQTEIGIKAMKDPAFREALLRDPKGTLQAELEKAGETARLPEDLQIRVHQEEPNTLHLFVPAEAGQVAGMKPLKSITNSETWRKTFGTWDCGCV